ncbi:MAG: hypothetical protein R3E12_07490, partial [Candidatus Eisenbacteria bacterium]
MARIVTITTLAALLLQIVPTRSPASPPDDGDRTVEIAFVAAIATASVLYAIHRHTRDPRRSNRERAEELIHYIATPEEKAELSALREDEVGPFLSRFFARRDPTPGTSDN